MKSLELSEVDVLAVGAHPDDVELGCGGTLLKLVREGRKAAILDLTRGELGTRGTPETRAAEADLAARFLNLSFRKNMGLADGNVRATGENRLELIRILRACRPRLVITHSASGHPDHWHTCQLVREAAHHAGLIRIETGQSRFRPEKIAYWLQYDQVQMPEVVVDISEFYSKKEDLLRIYGSQLHDPRSSAPETYLSQPDFLEQVRSHHRHLGNLARCRFGEGFLLSRAVRVDNLMNC